MNKKKKNSLTSKERKELRQGADDKKRKKKIDAPIYDEFGVAVVQAKDPKIAARKKMFIGIALVAAFVILVTSLILAFAVLPNTIYSHIDNPVAVIYLDNGDTIEFEIFENEVPDQATNFLYLCKIGFFNDTIIFDTTNEYVRFGQYESYDSYRSENEEFLATVTDIEPDYSSADIFDYRMKNSDSSSTSSGYIDNANQKMYLSLCEDISGTEFQICTSSGEQLYVNPKDGSSDQLDMSGYSLGMCLNEKSITVCEEIAAMEVNEDNGHNYWTGPAETITIEQVKLYNLDSEKWDNFNWTEYFMPDDGTSKVYWYYGSSVIE